MADEGDVLKDLDAAPAGNGPAGNGADTAPTAGIISQYVKDLSVENPMAPQSFRWKEAPQMDVQFNIAANGISEEITELELRINVTAKSAEGTAYIVELSYCGLVGLRNMAEEQAHAFLYAEAPRILFPFARRVISDATRDAGFAPLQLDPIDFNGLYVQQLAAKRAQDAGEAAGGAPVDGNA